MVELREEKTSSIGIIKIMISVALTASFANGITLTRIW